LRIFNEKTGEGKGSIFFAEEGKGNNFFSGEHSEVRGLRRLLRGADEHHCAFFPDGNFFRLGFLVGINELANERVDVKEHKKHEQGDGVEKTEAGPDVDANFHELGADVAWNGSVGSHGRGGISVKKSRRQYMEPFFCRLDFSKG